MFADQIVAKEFAITLYGSKMWGEADKTEKAQAIETCSHTARQLQQQTPTVFNTILRLRQSIDTSDPAV